MILVRCMVVLALALSVACTPTPPSDTGRPAVVHQDAAQVARHARTVHVSRSVARHALTPAERTDFMPADIPAAADVDAPPTVDVLRLAMCESIRDGSWAPWSTSTARGLFQFLPSTWASVGGTGDPAEASIDEQYHRLVLLWRRDGGSFREWSCASIVGLP